MQISFSQGGHFEHIRTPTLNGRGGGSWGCLQMMSMTPVMSSSSSTATVVSTGLQRTPGWATSTGSGSGLSAGELHGQGGEQAGLRRQRRQDLGSHPSLGCPHQEGPSYLQDSSTGKIHSPVPSCQFQNMMKEKSHCLPSREAHP